MAENNPNAFRKSIKSFGKKLRLFSIMPIAFLRRFFSSNTALRRISFDTNHSSPLLGVQSGQEIFVVSTKDQTIARHVYVRQEPFDFEKFELANKLLPHGHKRKTLIDVGANIGTICVPAVKRGFFDAAVAIEPEPSNFALLAANVHLNHLADRVTCYNKAAGAERGESIVFELSDINHGDHRISFDTSAPEGDKKSRIEVAMDGIDEMTSHLKLDKSEGLLWIDTQGYEGHALSGAGKLIKRGIPLCIEFWPYGLERSQGYPMLKEAVFSGGYTHFIDLDDPSQIVEFNEKNLDDLYGSLGNTGRNTDILIYS